jgi:hypothetical protein
MGNSRGLPRGSGRRGCRWSVHVTSGAATSKSAAYLLRDIKLTTSEGACPGDGISGADVPWSFGFEQFQHPFCAVRRPCRDDPPVGFAECLRRTHTRIVPPVWRRGLHVVSYPPVACRRPLLSVARLTACDGALTGPHPEGPRRKDEPSFAPRDGSPITSANSAASATANASSRPPSNCSQAKAGSDGSGSACGVAWPDCRSTTSSSWHSPARTRRSSRDSRRGWRSGMRSQGRESDSDRRPDADQATRARAGADRSPSKPAGGSATGLFECH